MPGGSGRYPSGQRGQTVNLLATAFGGSNPPLPTIDIGTSALPMMSNRGNSSAVERQPSKLGVAGSNPVSRSILQCEPPLAIRAEGCERSAARQARGEARIDGGDKSRGPM
jgi:hypothetical protein